MFVVCLCHSFFLGELEKCLEDPDKLAPLFVKQVHLFADQIIDMRFESY